MGRTKTVAILRSAMAIGVAAVVAVGIGPVAAAQATPAVPTDGTDWAARAISSYDAMQDNLYLGAAGHGLYREKAPASDGDNAYSYLWPYREAVAAAVDLQGIPGAGKAYQNIAANRFTSLENYYEVRDGGRAGYDSYVPAPLGSGGDVYYDDNTVVGLSFISQYQATGDGAYLDKARAAFDIVARGWNGDPSLACPGGMDWIDTANNTVRGANITGLAAQLSAHLYEITHDQSYLRWSKKLYDWNNRCLKQSAGLYQNSRNDNGTVDETLWTYNSGAMIGTAAILYRATDDPSYLTQAKRAASGSLAYWTTGNRLQQQPAIFNAFYFQDLLLLDSVSHDPAYRAAVEAYATQTWNNNRDATTGLFHFQSSGGGDYDVTLPAETVEQSAMVQIFAALAWDPRNLNAIA